MKEGWVGGCEERGRGRGMRGRRADRGMGRRRGGGKFIVTYINLL